MDLKYSENIERVRGYKLINKRNINSLILYYLKTRVISLEQRLDKMTMAGNIELRVPYLHEKIFKLAQKLPKNLKSNSIENKYILKKVAERYFPKEFIYRKKIGFSMPINKWMREENFIKEYISILNEKRTLSRSIYNSNSIKKLINDVKFKKDSFINSNAGKLWCLINLELWIRQFLENKKSISY